LGLLLVAVVVWVAGVASVVVRGGACVVVCGACVSTGTWVWVTGGSVVTGAACVVTGGGSVWVGVVVEWVDVVTGFGCWAAGFDAGWVVVVVGLAGWVADASGAYVVAECEPPVPPQPAAAIAIATLINSARFIRPPFCFGVNSPATKLQRGRNCAILRWRPSRY
jgi:hypothetical protein